MNGDRLARLTAINGRDKAAKDVGHSAAVSTFERPEPELSDSEPGGGEVAGGLTAAAESLGLEGGQPADQEAAQLRAENAELRRATDELRQILEEAKQLEESWARREKEYESLLEEKSEVIRDLHRKLQEAPAAGERPAGGSTPREEELLALHEELERERRQLTEDEESLMKQMREMELQMSRERAELARQRNELQRLHTDIRHELELAARDATLRERLAPLQRRAQDALNRRGAAPSAEASAQPAAQQSPAPRPQPARGSSGILRRLFG
jgi:hypothetical protein